MIDLFEAENLEIIIDWTGEKVWINTDDGCQLRAYKIKHLTVDDQRRHLGESHE